MRSSAAILFGLIITLVLSCADAAITFDNIIDQSIRAHGLDSMKQKKVSFEFRDFSYSVETSTDEREYRRIKIKDGDTIMDVLSGHNGYSRKINDSLVKVADSMAAKYSNSVNSVLYFFQIPLVLKEPAVLGEYLGETEIKGRPYHTLKVTFRREGGGKDFEDEFRYWIDKASLEVDYLAYSYLTDGGGIRFREAMNKRRIAGMLFQDYNNFKPKSPVVSLDSLPTLFAEGKLELLSKIENRNIQVH